MRKNSVVQDPIHAGSCTESGVNLAEPGIHFVITEDGVMEVIHNGEVSCKDLDISESIKCTEVWHDHETDEWVSELRNGVEICRCKTKEEAVAIEHGILAEMLMKGEKLPGDTIVSAIMRQIRRWRRKLK